MKGRVFLTGKAEMPEFAPSEINPSEALRRLNVFVLRAPSLARPLSPAEARAVRALIPTAQRAKPEDIGDIMVHLRKEELRGSRGEAEANRALDAITPTQKAAIGRFKIRSVVSEARTHLSTPLAWFVLRAQP